MFQGRSPNPLNIMGVRLDSMEEDCGEDEEMSASSPKGKKASAIQVIVTYV